MRRTTLRDRITMKCPCNSGLSIWRCRITWRGYYHTK